MPFIRHTLESLHTAVLVSHLWHSRSSGVPRASFRWIAVFAVAASVCAEAAFLVSSRATRTHGHEMCLDCIAWCLCLAARTCGVCACWVQAPWQVPVAATVQAPREPWRLPAPARSSGSCVCLLCISWRPVLSLRPCLGVSFASSGLACASQKPQQQRLATHFSLGGGDKEHCSRPSPLATQTREKCLAFSLAKTRPGEQRLPHQPPSSLCTRLRRRQQPPSTLQLEAPRKLPQVDWA